MFDSAEVANMCLQFYSLKCKSNGEMLSAFMFHLIIIICHVHLTLFMAGVQNVHPSVQGPRQVRDGRIQVRALCKKLNQNALHRT